MSNLENKLKAVLDKNDLTAIIYASTDGTKIKNVGNLDSLPEKGLELVLFGDEYAVRNLYECIHNEILPHMWGQGDVTCFIDIAANDRIFGVFGIVKKEEIEQKYLQSKVFCKEIKEMLEKHL